MKSIVLVPYCPWPADTGTKVEMMKHLSVLRELGPCTIASARGKPVGFGWSREACTALTGQGFDLVFREDFTGLGPAHVFGTAYAAVCKGLRRERAFGHANPYHRYAFSERWWQQVAVGFDLAVMQYGFWARFHSPCPTAIVVHELLSNYHRGGSSTETRELKKADRLVVVGKDEEELLKARGMRNVLWSPPAVKAVECPLTTEVGMIGSLAPQNLEGLRWLGQAPAIRGLRVRVYGNVARVTTAPFLEKVGRYEDQYTPYRECGIHLMTRDDRPGLQIKAVEALACGRAIVARRGSMRGLPQENKCWIEVETPAQMLEAAHQLRQDEATRRRLSDSAKVFYGQHLEYGKLIADLKRVYGELAGAP